MLPLVEACSPVGVAAQDTAASIVEATAPVARVILLSSFASVAADALSLAASAAGSALDGPLSEDQIVAVGA